MPPNEFFICSQGPTTLVSSIAMIASARMSAENARHGAEIQLKIRFLRMCVAPGFAHFLYDSSRLGLHGVTGLAR